MPPEKPDFFKNSEIIPNLHRIHIITIGCKCKYRILFFRYKNTVSLSCRLPVFCPSPYCRKPPGRIAHIFCFPLPPETEISPERSGLFSGIKSLAFSNNWIYNCMLKSIHFRSRARPCRSPADGTGMKEKPESRETYG